MSRKKLTAFDLYSGPGGLTLGLHQAGFRVVGAVEVDDLAVETYKANHRRVRVWASDVRKLDPRRLMSELGFEEGDLDLLAGCPPCQGFSRIRTLNQPNAVSDERNDLVLDFLRFARAFRPKAVMVENVPGLVEDERFEKLCHGLSRMKYEVGFAILDASDYGVPQRRRRVIVLGGRTGPIPFALCNDERMTVRQALAGLPPPGRSGDELHDFPERRSPEVMDRIRAVPKNGGSRRDLGSDEQLRCHKRVDGFWDVYGRMAWDDVAPTITSGCINPSKGRFLHPDQDRCITLREAALLQGFPVDYYFSLKRGKFAAAAMIGNALPPEFVRRHGTRVAAFIRSHLQAGHVEAVHAG